MPEFKSWLFHLLVVSCCPLCASVFSSGKWGSWEGVAGRTEHCVWSPWNKACPAGRESWTRVSRSRDPSPSASSEDAASAAGRERAVSGWWSGVLKSLSFDAPAFSGFHEKKSSTGHVSVKRGVPVFPHPRPRPRDL